MSSVERFPYLPATNRLGEIVLRPRLPLILSHQSISRPVVGLLDTGADVNVLPYNIGLELGAVWSEQKQVFGLSGNLATYEARGIVLTANIGDLTPVRLAFAWSRAETVPVLLGQMNFFVAFDVCFFRSEATFDIRPK